MLWSLRSARNLPEQRRSSPPPPPLKHTYTCMRAQGLLWTWYKKLRSDGWTLDANGYTTSFR